MGATTVMRAMMRVMWWKNFIEDHVMTQRLSARSRALVRRVGYQVKVSSSSSGSGIVSGGSSTHSRYSAHLPQSVSKLSEFE